MEILPNVHRIANSVSTAYLIVDDKNGITLIDTGPGHFGRVILTYLSQIGRRTDEVKRILLTHRHFDHIGGALGMRDATHAPVWAHRLDAPQIDGRERNRMPKGIVGVAMGVIAPLAFPFSPCPVDDYLEDQQEFDLGSVGPLQVLHTPGHTIGHCSFYLPSRKLLVIGDALNNFSGKPRVSPDFLNDDTALANKTGVTLSHIDAEALVFGHGHPILEDGQQHLRAAAQAITAVSGQR